MSAALRKECDYLVIGAGASGCVVAARLAESGDARVILVEAGGSDRSPFVRIPALGFAAGVLDRLNWNFRTEPMPELNGRALTLQQGRVLGGSSSINGMIYSRGHPGEYDRWSEAGCDGWAFEDLLPFFRKSEANARGADRWHGGSGPMPLRRARSALPIQQAFLEAAASVGIPTVDDLNRDQPEGFGWYDVNIANGLRMSSARSYLAPDRRPANLEVLLGARALRIVVAGGRATGAEILWRGEALAVHAAREIVVSGGGIKSPHLLMLSGIGPADHLRAHGIAVAVDSPGVGANLQNHPCYRPRYNVRAPVTARNHVRPLGALKAGVAYALRRSGPLAESFASVGGFFRSDPGLPVADMQAVMVAALPPAGQPGTQGPLDLLPKEQGFAVTVYQGTPFSRGKVSLRSADPLAQPRIDAGYFTDSRDIAILASGLERIRAAMRAPALAGFGVTEAAPGPHVTSREELIAEIRRAAATSYHQSGTCAMGPAPSDVLDPRLRVRGVEGLRVADVSIMPRMPNAALHAPALMIGEKAAAMIIEDAGMAAPAATSHREEIT